MVQKIFKSAVKARIINTGRNPRKTILIGTLPQRMRRIAERALRYLHRNAAQVSPDSQGRIVLPASLLEYAEIEKEAVVVGCSDYCEMWSLKNYRAEIESEDADEIRAELERLGL